jgi:hypothetical protein
MASNEPIEKLYVKLEADVRDLLTKGEDAINKLERKMDDLDKKGKQAGRFTQFKAGLDKLVRSIRAAQAAVIAFGAAFIAAFRLAQEAVADLRIERSFFSLANAAEQSGERILKAMREASRGAIDDLALMQQANLAMQLGVAKTPEEFEKLTKSAIALGAALGRGPVEALNDLIIAAGRRSRLVLDNLGLSLGEVNQLMDEFARVEFGKTVDQLSQIQRDMLFTRATIEAANRKAEQLGGNLEDAGTSLETLAAQSKNFRSELGQTTLILFTMLNQLGGGEGILKRLREGAIAWQGILIQIAALIMAINDTLDTIGVKMKDFGKLFDIRSMMPATKTRGLIGKILKGEPVNEEDFIPGVKIARRIGERIGQGLIGAEDEAEEAGKGLGETFAESFSRNLAELEKRFQDILDPEAAAKGLGTTPGPTIDPDPTEESADEIRDILNDLTTDMIDATEERQAALEELEQDHAERLADIAAEGAKRRARIEQDYQRDLEELARDTERRRAEIFRDTQRDLEDLARDTNEALNDEREDFQTEERRETEDHLRAMRRLTEDYLFDLDDAVKERDARAVVDLQRRFALESQRREEDFSVNQMRDREDQDQRLREIRENEARRREEILASQAQELADLMIHEAERRADIEASRQEQIARLDEQLAEQRARENENYAERKADLEAALKERLAAIAKELADEEKVNEEGARRILTALNRYFGAGGEIDKLMDDFVSRRSQRMRVEISFEASTQGAQEGLGSTLPGGSGYGRIPRFQHGGTLLARKPTLAMFGEAGPEVAQFTPLGQARGGGQPRRIQIEFSGSAPPGIRGTERDQIANVLLDALRDTGVMER